jgi:hypothetical protein
MVDKEMQAKRKAEQKARQKAISIRITEILNSYNETSYAKLASNIGVAPQALGKWKKEGKIEPEHARSLASHTNYNHDWILFGDFPKKKPKGKLASLEVSRLILIIEAIDNYEKKLPKNTKFSLEQRARYINEMYRDKQLQSSSDFSNRMAEIVPLFG